MSELLPGLHRIDTALGDRVSSLYLVVGDRTGLLFDTGTAGDLAAHVMPYLSRIGLDPADVRWSVVSHCDVDHFGGVGDVAEVLPRSAVVAHDLDADAVESYEVFERERARGLREEYGCDEDPDVLVWTRSVTREGPVDLRLTGEARLDLGNREIRILHLPGHTRGHLALHDVSTGSAVVADAVLGDAVLDADQRPVFPPTYRWVDEYLETIRRLRALAPARLLTAHYPTMDADEALAFLDLSEQFALGLEDDVLAAISAEPLTLAELASRLSRTAGSWPAEGTAGAMAYPVAGHIERLVAADVATVCGSREESPLFGRATS